MERTLKDKLRSLMIAATTDNGHMNIHDLISSFNLDDPTKIRDMALDICKESGWSYKHYKIWREK